MSDDRVALLRSVFEAVSSRDVDAVLEVMTDDVVIDGSRRVIDPVVYGGHEGVRQYARFLADAWRENRIVAEEFIEAGDSMVVPVRLVSIGRGSGVTVNARAAWVATFHGDKIARLSVYQTRSDALAAIGLADS